MASSSYLALDSDETIIAIFHRHFINFFPILVSTILIVIASFFGEGWLTTHQSQFTFLPVPQLTAVLMVIVLLAIGIAVAAYFIFQQSRIILTNKHLIQITQAGLFGRDLSKFSLDELQDVKGSRKGLFATIFNYGDLLIQTAGESDNFLFRPVGDPLNVAAIINGAHESFEKAHNFVRP